MLVLTYSVIMVSKLHIAAKDERNLEKFLQVRLYLPFPVPGVIWLHFHFLWFVNLGYKSERVPHVGLGADRW